MKTPRTLLAALCFLSAVATECSAAIISGSWNFAATSGSTSFTGTFSFANLDTSLTYSNSTAAGFSVTTNFDTSGNGGNAFSFAGGTLVLGGLVGGVDSASGNINDWLFVTTDFLTGRFVYFGSTSATATPNATVSSSRVPEPGSVALLGLASLAVALARTSRRPK